MIAFVTGGTGFIGSHLVDALLAKPENSVRCLVRNEDRWLSGKRFERITGTLHDLEALKKGCENADVVFHLAGAVKAPDLKAFIRENVEGTENLVRIAQKAGTKHVVVLSSLAANGPSSGIPLEETAPRAPVSAYGVSKMKMEQSLEALKPAGMHLAVIRPPAVFGPREENILPLFKMMQRGLCPVTGKGSSRISMVYVQDLVSGILLAGERCPAGVHTYFVSGEEPYSWSEIANTGSVIFGRAVRTLPVSPQLVRTAGKLFERMGKITGKTAFFNQEKALEVTSEWLCSIEKAKAELGYQPVYSLEQGLKETILWYKKHHWL